MNTLVHQLTSPFHFLLLRRSLAHCICMWGVPVLLSAVVGMTAYFFVDINTMKGKDGLISEINDVFLILPGFFIASLAAVSTFNRPSMDAMMERSPLKLTLYNNRVIWLPMTRRVFLSSLFSYLAAITILLVITTRIVTSLPDPTGHKSILSWIGVFSFIFISAQILIASLIGAYYLSEGAHVSSPAKVPENHQ